MATQAVPLYEQVVAAYRAGDLDAVDRLTAPSLAAGSIDIRLAEILGATRMRQGRPAEAVGFFRALCAAAPENGTAALHLAGALYNSGDYGEALLCARRAAELDDDLADAHFLAGIATPGAFNPIDVQAAQHHLRRATELRPDWFDAHFHLGRFLSYSSKEDEAERAFRRALELNDASWNAHEELGNILLENHRVDEAMAEYERALELNPSASISRAERDRLAAARNKGRERLARYPRSKKEFDDVDQFIEKYLLVEFRDAKPFITAQTPIFTLGSCFALNIANALKSYGVPAISVPYPEDINNTFANRLLLEWLLDPATPGTAPYDEQLGGAQREGMLQGIKAAKMVIVSLGVAPAFFDAEAGNFALTFGANFTAALSASKYRFRTTSVGENVENIKAMIEMLRRLNPDVQVMLTVSPVPLKATFERPSAVVADCISKSTLRVAAHEIMQSGLENVWYWPSYEAVRWMGGHAGPVFGVDDGSPFHVSQELIRKIMYAFVRVFGKGEIIARAEATLAASR